MSIAQSPLLLDELLEIIVDYLDHPTLLSARGVSRAWCSAATRFLFHTITMTPTIEGIRKWEAVIKSEHLSRMVRCVVLNSSPLHDHLYWISDFYNDEFAPETILFYKWQLYQCRDCRQAPDFHRCEHRIGSSQYRSFYNSLYDVTELPSLRKVCINFNQECATEDFTSRAGGFEDPQGRDDIMFRVFRAIRKRLQRTEISTITSLSVENLQNVAFFLDTLKHFHHATRTIEHLELLVTEEFNHFDGSDSFLYPETRRTFMHHLKSIWLIPLSSRLKSLSLSFHFYWGALPSRFNGDNLEFPRLKTLQLAKYCLSYDQSMDWVLRQKSLEHLHLRNCGITSHFKLSPEYIEECKVPLTDWERWVGPWLDLEADPTFTGQFYCYTTTWDHYLDRIRAELPHLTRFTLDWKTNGSYSIPPRNWFKRFYPPSVHPYIAFMADCTFPGPWVESSCDDFHRLRDCNRCGICVKHPSIKDKDEESLAKLLAVISLRSQGNSRS